MKAISIRQPWAWAILHAGKRVENRDWRGAPSYRGPILIHAAKWCTWDEYADAVPLIRRASRAPGLHVPVPSELPRGGIVGRATLISTVRTTDAGHRIELPVRDLVCQLCGGHAFASGVVCPKADPWAILGALGLILADAEPLPFVQCRGALGLFNANVDAA